MLAIADVVTPKKFGVLQYFTTIKAMGTSADDAVGGCTVSVGCLNCTQRTCVKRMDAEGFVVVRNIHGIKVMDQFSDGFIGFCFCHIQCIIAILRVADVNLVDAT